MLPNEENYQQKRIEFTSEKTMYLYAFELGFVVKTKLLKKLDLQATIGLGMATISKRTERLAKGFTFIENGSLGLSYQTSNKTFLYLGSNIGHVSNFNLKSLRSFSNLAIIFLSEVSTQIVLPVSESKIFTKPIFGKWNSLSS